MANASLRSYVNHHDQSGLSRPNYKGKNGDNNNAIYLNKAIDVFKVLRKAINIFKAIMEFKAWDFHGSNAYGITWWLKPH